MNGSIITSSLVHFSFIISIVMIIVIYRRKQKSFVQFCFLALAFTLFIWNLGTMLELDYRLITGETTDSTISIMLIDLCYLAICVEPVVLFCLGKAIYYPEWRPSLRYLALLIVPIISFMMVTTNPLHHLFFKNFSLYASEAVYGAYFYFHSIYSYALIIIGLVYIVRVAIRDSGLFSTQFFLIFGSILIPLVGNILFSFGLADLSFSINATLFTISSICIFIAIIKYHLFTDTNIVDFKSRNEAELQNTLMEVRDQLEEEKQAKQSLYDSDPNINFIMDLNHNVIDCNPSAIKFYGFENKEEFKAGLEEKLNKSILEKLPGSSDKVSINDRIKAALENGDASFDTRLMFDGREIPFHFYLKIISYRGEDVVAVYQTDLRDLRQMEKDLERRDILLTAINTVAARLISAEDDDLSRSFGESIALLGRSIDVQRVVVWRNYTIDGELYCTQISDWCEGAETQYGLAHTKDIKYSEAFPSWETVFKSGNCVNSTVANLQDDGLQEMMTWQGIVSVLAVPLFVRDSLWGFVGFDDCVRERTFTEIEENTLAAGAMLIAAALFRNEITGNLIVAREDALSSARAKSSFLANMSHEIRTPLNAIVGMANIAKRKTENQETLKPIDEILAASKHLMDLINDILDFSKIESGKMELINEAFDIYDAMQEVSSLIKPRCVEKNISFEPNLEQLPKVAVAGDKLRLKQVLINLLGNAVKFTDECGVIKFVVEKITQSDNEITLQFLVNDNGIGLTEEQKPKLFTAFEQGDSTVSIKYGGTGLGLAISQNIISAMGGIILVDSKYKEGSTFKFTITLQQMTSLQLPKVSESIIEDFSLKGNRILLAEDIDINRVIVTELLADTGIDIQEATDGLHALHLFEQSEIDYYDLIFMDVQMPTMDGYQSTRAIRKLDRSDAKSIPIIAMTANAYREDVDKALDAGMNGHLAKPIDIEAVRKLLYDKLR